MRCSSRNLTLLVLECSSKYGEFSSTSRSSSGVGLRRRESKIAKTFADDLGKVHVELNHDKLNHEKGDRQDKELPQVVTYSDERKHTSARFGVSISKKVSKKAVVRNRIKRHLKAAFRQLLPRVTSHWLIVVVVRPSAVQCDYWQFLQELEQTLTSAEVIDGHS